MAETKPKRRRRTVGATANEPPQPIGRTPEQEAEYAATQALGDAFVAVVKCAKVVPLHQTIGITMEALAFAARQQGKEGLVGRIGEMKAELMGMQWE